jgi:hypothetical protein
MNLSPRVGDRLPLCMQWLPKMDQEYSLLVRRVCLAYAKADLALARHLHAI